MKIFIGWDSREVEAYDVCVSSLRRHTDDNLEIIPLITPHLIGTGLYSRPVDPLAATEFTYTRFLTPHLAKTEHNHNGWAMFVDCDFLFTANVKELFKLVDNRFAAMVVKHPDYVAGKTKMDGVVQTTYPRKNWSSLIMFNCGHPAVDVLTPSFVSSASGAVLHRFSWLSDELLGELPPTWNWLVGTYEKPKEGPPPKAIHYTIGAPNFANCQDVDYADLWRAERDLPL